MAIRDEETAKKEVKAAKEAAQTIHDEAYVLQETLSNLDRYFRVTSEDFNDYGNNHRMKKACESLRQSKKILELVRQALQHVAEFTYPYVDQDAEEVDKYDQESSNKNRKNARLGGVLELRPDEDDADEDEE